MKSLLILGSTGSIGTQALDVVRASPGAFRVEGLAARGSADLLLAQIREFAPSFAALADPAAAERIRADVPSSTRLFAGEAAVLELIEAARFDLAVHGIVGAAGVLPSQRVLERGADLALANKESLVVAGAPLMELARARGARILPVDSEHSAIFQCLDGRGPEEVRRVWLTASGGPLRDLPLDRLAAATPEQALAHPNWDMGPRVTVGSATLMNKALEVIECHHLFGLAAEQIEVVVHRQSLVHSLVEFVDGSVLAQMGPPDMRLPIHCALHWPRRAPSALRGFDVESFRRLSFEAPDRARFPALELGYRCVRAGGAAGAVLNAADEEAVAAFLRKEIAFTDICRIDRAVLDSTPPGAEGAGSIGALLAADSAARTFARSLAREIATSAGRTPAAKSA